MPPDQRHSTPTPQAHEDSAAAWRELLARSDDRHLEALASVERVASSAKPGARSSLLVALAEPLALLVSKRGPTVAQRACDTHRALLETTAQELGSVYQRDESRVALALLSLRVVAEAAGARFDCSALDEEAWLSELVWLDQFANEERSLLALLALAMRRPQHADTALDVLGTQHRPGSSFDAFPSWVAWLAHAVKSPASRAELDQGWSALLQAFPGWLKRKDASWQHLLVAARIVLGDLGGVPTAEVAETLHRQVALLSSPA
jgi:hypothetical protein